VVAAVVSASESGAGSRNRPEAAESTRTRRTVPLSNCTTIRRPRVYVMLGGLVRPSRDAIWKRELAEPIAWISRTVAPAVSPAAGRPALSARALVESNHA
jgi:hypothetical protein